MIASKTIKELKGKTFTLFNSLSLSLLASPNFTMSHKLTQPGHIFGSSFLPELGAENSGQNAGFKNRERYESRLFESVIESITAEGHNYTICFSLLIYVSRFVSHFLSLSLICTFLSPFPPHQFLPLSLAANNEFINILEG